MSNASNNPKKKAVPLFSNRLREQSPKANKRRQCSCISKRTVTTHEELHAAAVNIWGFHCNVCFYIFYSEGTLINLFNCGYFVTISVCSHFQNDWYGRKVVKEFIEISYVAVLCYRCLAITRQWYHTIVVAISVVVISRVVLLRTTAILLKCGLYVRLMDLKQRLDRATCCLHAPKFEGRPFRSPPSWWDHLTRHSFGSAVWGLWI